MSGDKGDPLLRFAFFATLALAITGLLVTSSKNGELRKQVLKLQAALEACESCREWHEKETK